jgi:hypothetical protein
MNNFSGFYDTHFAENFSFAVQFAPLTMRILRVC